MTQIMLPDGTIAEFPDTMTNEQITAILRQHIGAGEQAAPQPSAPAPTGGIPEGMFLNPETGQYTSREMIRNNMAPRGRFDALTSGAAQGLTMGFGDELAGAVGGDMLRERVRAATETDRAQYPGTQMAGEIGAAVSLPAAAVARGGSAAARAGIGALTGGAQGALYGAGTAEGGAKPRTQSALMGGGIGAAFGAAAPAVGKLAKQAYDSKSLRSAFKRLATQSPSVADLKAEARRIYQAADNAGGMPRDQFTIAAEDMLNKAQRRGMDQMLTPEASRVMHNVAGAGLKETPDIGFSELDILRRQAQIPAGDVTNRTQSAIGSGMVEGLDNFVRSASPELAAEIGKAREMWSRLSKSRTVQEIIDRAEMQASGFENGLRIGFRSLLNNKKAVRGFSEAERAAMKQIVEGTTFGNLMKKVGKLGFGMNQQSNMLGGGLAMAGGAGLGSSMGPLGAAVGASVPPLLGYMGQKASENITSNAANQFAAAVRGGGLLATPQMSNATRGLLEESIRRTGQGAVPMSMPIMQGR